MAKFNFCVAALLACVAVVSASGSPYTDEQGNPCPPCPTTKELKPVCGSNGKTYLNLSLLKCHSVCLKSEIKKEHPGPCRLSDLPTRVPPRKVRQADCPCAATFDINPVCGTNGETYDNVSLLRCAAHCQKSDISVQYSGPCQ